ncbi:MAG: acyltransferase [Candidatus Sericytochromatia bacterium]
MKKNLYFSGLDGIRAIAAIAVLFSHTTVSLSSFGLKSHIFGINQNGDTVTTQLAGFGVSIFFTLSGFLITYLLLEEKKLSEINIKYFYIRRILRIWPLYYLYFILSIITLLVFNLQFNISWLPFYLLLLANIPFVFGCSIDFFLCHYWSLGVEEQFYSIWPWIIKKSKSLLKSTLVIVFIFIFLKFLLHYLNHNINNNYTSFLYRLIHLTRFQCMLFGAIGSILYFEKNTFFIKFSNNIITQIISWSIIFISTINRFNYLSLISHEIISIITVFLIIGQINQNNNILNLNTSFFNFIGKISYGIYVLHPIVIFYLSKLIIFNNKEYVLNYMIVYLSVFFITILLSYISYDLFEKRFLLIKDMYSVKTIQCT